MWQIDSQKLTATAHWSLAPCKEPSGLAMDPSIAACLPAATTK